MCCAFLCCVVRVWQLYTLSSVPQQRRDPDTPAASIVYKTLASVQETDIVL